MTPERWKKIDDLVQAALDCAPEDRSAFLIEACKGDEALKREAESLISLEADASGFLEQPALELAGEVIAEAQQNMTAGCMVGHYQVERKIGGGGMGDVYLARDTRLGRNVALKLLPESLISSSESRSRFLREAQLASVLDHPNICTIYEIGQDSGQRFIAMQYVEGETLKQVIDNEPLDLKSMLSISLQVADALRAAHSQEIIHRDIKSTNIMITRRGQAKVLDFGLAKSLEKPGRLKTASTEAQLTRTGATMGTPAYMSPEQARGEAVDYRSDIFSFGVVLYEMATGRLSFKEPSEPETMNAIINKPHAPAIEVNRDLPVDLSAVIDRALAKRAADRYQSMDEVIEDLRPCARAVGLRSADLPDGLIASYAATKRRSALNRVRRWALRPATIVAAAAVLTLSVAFYVLWVKRPPSTAAVTQIRSLAVLPFRSLNQETKEDYLGLGFATDIITKISQSGELTVRPVSSVRKYSDQEMNALEAARELKVDAILDSSFLHVGDQLRVSVNLLRVRDGASLWAERFDERFTDIFAIQDKVSQQVAQRLRLKLDPAEQARLTKRQTSNPEAYNYYTKAMYHFWNITPSTATRSESDLAVDLFKKAIDLEPNYALAHAYLGYAYARIAVFQEDSPALIQQSKSELGIAEMLDPQLAEAHVARYFILFSQYEGWQVEATIRELRLAQKLDPHAGHTELGDLFNHIGLEKQAIEEFESALSVDPNNDAIKNSYVTEFFLTARPDEGLEASKRFFNHGPDSRYYVEKRMVNEAIPLVEQEYQKSPTAPQALAGRILLLALQGRHHEAEDGVGLILNERRNRGYHHGTYAIARIYALGGKSEEAVKWLRVTVKEGFPSYPLFARDPYLDPIRSNPAFIQFMAEMKSRWDTYQRDFG